jgi:formylglycine-generating enzyme required for sulfatase activity
MDNSLPPCLLVIGLLSSTAIGVTLPTVPVGHTGNAGELSGAGAGGLGTDRICGAVDYTYRMGQYEVTAGQYTAFLNAVARTDTHGLYAPNMDYAAYPQWYGCDIKRTGSPGNYSYSVAADRADRPVNWASWGDAARFANWMHNGQKSGLQDATTTEDGSYSLNGATTAQELLAVERRANATWVIPTEDEWYKAAYYDPAKPGGAGYWDYPTRSDAAPINVLDPTGINNANFYDYQGTGTGGYTIGEPYWRTEVGAFANSSSPYGTFDQGGNVWEWNEAFLGSVRGLRGGTFSYGTGVGYLHAATRGYGYTPTYEHYVIGFRLVQIPEPATLAFLAIGGAAALRRFRQKR